MCCPACPQSRPYRIGQCQCPRTGRAWRAEAKSMYTQYVYMCISYNIKDISHRESMARADGCHAVTVLTRVKAACQMHKYRLSDTGTPESSGSQRKPRASCASWFSRAPASRMSRLGGCSSAGCDWRPPILKWTAYCAEAVYLCVTSLPTALLRVSCSRSTVAPCSTQMMAMLPKPSTSSGSIIMASTRRRD